MDETEKILNAVRECEGREGDKFIGCVVKKIESERDKWDCETLFEGGQANLIPFEKTSLSCRRRI